MTSRVSRCCLTLVLAGAACTTSSPGQLSAGESILVRAEPVLLNSADPSQKKVGRLTYAGGVRLTSSDDRFAGLTGLDGGYGPLIAVTRGGHLLQFTPVLDSAGQLLGVRDVTASRLRDEHGRPEAETPAGLTYTRTARIAVSFSSSRKLLSYADGADRPVRLAAPAPQSGEAEPLGFTALAALRAVAPFTVPAAPDGRLWWCINTQPEDAPEPCLALSLKRDFDAGLQLTGLDLGPLDFGPLYGVFQRRSGQGGVQAVIARIDSADAVDAYSAQTLGGFQAPLTTAQFSGLAALENGLTGDVRLFVISDEQAGALLLAFDYSPQP